MCELTRAVFSSVLLEAAATQLSEAEAAAPALRSQVRDSRSHPAPRSQVGKWLEGQHMCLSSGCHWERYLQGQGDDKITLCSSQKWCFYLPLPLPEVSHLLRKIQIMTPFLVTYEAQFTTETSSVSFGFLPNSVSAQHRKETNAQEQQFLLTQQMSCGPGFAPQLHISVWLGMMYTRACSLETNGH